MISDRFRELAGASGSRLEEILRMSRGPAPESLAWFEWCGYNAPWFTRLLGIQKFIKGFFQEGGRVEGYNIPVQQNGIEAPWLYRHVLPKRFGFYYVAWVDRDSRDNFYPDAVLLNYGASPRSAPYRVERIVRDYIVQPDPAVPDLLLGKAYLAMGSARIPSSFFVLERLRPTSWKP